MSVENNNPNPKHPDQMPYLPDDPDAPRNPPDDPERIPLPPDTEPRLPIEDPGTDVTPPVQEPSRPNAPQFLE